MPHFVVDCSEDIVAAHDEQQLIRVVFDVARDSGLFRVQDIKVRIRRFSAFTVGGGQSSFLHVFAWIMEGRTQTQKKTLSTAVVSRLSDLLPEVLTVSMNVMDFEKSTYSNRQMLE